MAIARASRWIAVAAIAFAMVALAGLLLGRSDQITAVLALCLAVLLGAAEVYLALRVEFDRSIFEAAASGSSDAAAYFEAFDQSRSQLGLGTPKSEARSVGERVWGLIRLVRAMGTVFILQVISVLAGVWIARWPS